MPPVSGIVWDSHVYLCVANKHSIPPVLWEDESEVPTLDGEWRGRDKFRVASFPSTCWDPLQTLGVCDERSESVI